MTPSVIETAVRLLFAAYLLLVALMATRGWHRPLLAYPFRIGYSAIRLVVATATFGKITMVPAGKKIKRRGSRKLRNWRFELQEWRELRAEKRGEVTRPAGTGWSVSSNHEDSHYEELPPPPPPNLYDETPASVPASVATPPPAPPSADPEDEQADYVPPFVETETYSAPEPPPQPVVTPTPEPSSTPAPRPSLFDDDEDDEDEDAPPLF